MSYNVLDVILSSWETFSNACLLLHHSSGWQYSVGGAIVQQCKVIIEQFRDAAHFLRFKGIRIH